MSPAGPWPGRGGGARRIVQALVGAAVLLAACTSSPPRAPPPPPPVPEPVVPPLEPIRRTSIDDQFCDGMTIAIDAWRDAFEKLRLASDGPGRWHARPLDGELGRCLVDGTNMLTAAYVCLPTMEGRGDQGSVDAMFRRIEGRIDRCLARPSWYPRSWAKAPPIQLSAGERQILWRDQTAWPRPAIRLKFEENYRRPGTWTLRLTSYTMR